MNFNFEDSREQVAALVPYYDENGGNCTKIFTTSGEEFHDRRDIRWILKKIARIYALDLQALRHNTNQILGIKQGTPLFFSHNLVLVPLKLRKIIGKSDGAYGYVNICAVEKADDYPLKNNIFKSLIYLQGEVGLPCVFTRKTVEEQLSRGKIIKRLYGGTTGDSFLNSTVREGEATEHTILLDLPKLEISAWIIPKNKPNN